MRETLPRLLKPRSSASRRGVSPYRSVASRCLLSLCCLAALSACDDQAEPARDETAAEEAGARGGALGGGVDGVGAAGAGVEAGAAGGGDQAGQVGPSCDESRAPVVFAHGFLAAGDTWSRHVRRFTALGACPERLVAFDWNSLQQNQDHAAALSERIDELLAESGAEQIDLIGHSAGGGLGYGLLSDPVRALKVRRYVHIASFPNEGPAGPEGSSVPTLNLRSLGDTTVEGADIPGATNVTLNEEDHYGVATSFASFQAIYEFLYDERVEVDPLSAELSGDSVSLSGKLVTLGENAVISGAAVELWSLNAEGERQERVAELSVDERGRYEREGLSRGARYELAPLNTGEGAPLVRYFIPPLLNSDPLLYLRAFPGPGTLASVLVRQLPRDESQSSLVVFNAHQAFLAGRDSLTLNGQELLTEEVASAEDTAIALFIFDVNGDGEPGGTLPLFESFPFLSVIDLPIDPLEESPLRLSLNGQEVTLPRAPSSEATLITVFP